ncbi:uncharacterized protein LOC144097587 isoform X1 [Amblyomma americanum]
MSCSLQRSFFTLLALQLMAVLLQRKIACSCPLEEMLSVQTYCRGAASKADLQALWTTRSRTGRRRSTWVKGPGERPAVGMSARFARTMARQKKAAAKAIADAAALQSSEDECTAEMRPADDPPHESCS